MSAFSFNCSAFVATVSVDFESSQVRSFLESSSGLTGAWLVVSIVMLGEFSKCPVSPLCFVTLSASTVNSEDSPAGLVKKCAIPWLGDERLVEFGELFGE